MKMENKPEILAPAGSMESLKAGIAAGCDAVYMGGARFGARAYAKNPDEDEMLQAIRYCHRYGVKLYMTVNTLLKERELENSLYNYLLPYYLEGLDAVIVQDVGVMKYIHERFPKLPIHASTQMNLTMGESTGFLEKYGVNRIVPARELSLEELADMRKNTDVEIEVFVHGALCYCYSGQCLFSSMLGGRSGNRGRCAQPCRMPYQIPEYAGNIGKFILSPKEHCNLPRIAELIEAGVNSFKIEGRMKRPEYTALTVAMYRKYVDLYEKYGKENYQKYLDEHKQVWEEDMRRLAEIYNRSGFTSGYLDAEAGTSFVEKKGRGKMLSDSRPKHGGVLVGEVVAVDKREVKYRLLKNLSAQDVVEFRDRAMNTIYEYTLGEAKKKGMILSARYQKGCHIQKGDRVFRTKDAPLLKEIRKKYIEKEKVIPVNVFVTARQGEPFRVKICAGEDSVEKVGAVCEPAKNIPSEPAAVKKLLQQTGGTCFVVQTMQIDWKGQIFLPVGVVKKMRRELLAELLEKKETSFCRPYPASKENEFDGLKQENVLGKVNNTIEKTCTPERKKKKMVSVLTQEQAELAIQYRDVDEVYLSMDKMTDVQLKTCLKKGTEAGKKMYLIMPRIMREIVYQKEKEKLSQPENIYENKHVCGFVIQNLESFHFLTYECDLSPERMIAGSCLYTWNKEAIEFWRKQGITRQVLPLELSEEEIKSLLPLESAQFICYAHMPLMVSAQCLRYNADQCRLQKAGRDELITFSDEKGREYICSNCCKYCYNMIYQKEPYVLCKEVEKLYQLGISEFCYDFTIESCQEMKEVLDGNVLQGHTGHYFRAVE